MYVFYLLFFLVLMSYFYFSFLLVLLVMEFFLLYVYMYCGVIVSCSLFSHIMLMVLACYFVVEAIMGLNLLIMMYRFKGVTFFSMW